VSYPSRKRLDHRIPAFAQWDATYFLTICCVQRGTNSLCHSERAATIFGSVQTYETLGKWSVRIMLLMPDHLHALVDFPFWGDMGCTVQQWKRFCEITTQLLSSGTSSITVSGRKKPRREVEIYQNESGTSRPNQRSRSVAVRL